MLADPQLDVARRQVTHFLDDRKHSIGEDVHRAHESFNARGVGQSSMAQQSVARHIRAELIARYQFTWEIYRRFLTETDRQDATGAQVKALTHASVETSMPEIERLSRWGDSLMAGSGVMGDLNEQIHEARARTEAAIDEYFLTTTSPVDGARAAVQADMLVDPIRIDQLRAMTGKRLDPTRLTGLCDEINISYVGGAYMAVAALTRAILDHVPPVFGVSTFGEVANNYPGARSFKDSMRHLNESARTIADAHLHVQMRAREVVPTRTQVYFGNDLDVLLGEIVRILG